MGRPMRSARSAEPSWLIGSGGDIYISHHGGYAAYDDLIHKLLNGAEPVNPIPPIYMYIDQP